MESSSVRFHFVFLDIRKTNFLFLNLTSNKNSPPPPPNPQSPSVELATAPPCYICPRGDGRRDPQVTYHRWGGVPTFGTHTTPFFSQDTLSHVEFGLHVGDCCPSSVCVCESEWRRLCMHTLVWDLTLVGAGCSCRVIFYFFVCLFNSHQQRILTPPPLCS